MESRWLYRTVQSFDEELGNLRCGCFMEFAAVFVRPSEKSRRLTAIDASAHALSPAWCSYRISGLNCGGNCGGDQGFPPLHWGTGGRSTKRVGAIRREIPMLYVTIIQVLSTAIIGAIAVFVA